MKFISCRGDSDKQEFYSLEQCVLGAYAQDGGMFLPAEIPQLSGETLRSWSKLSFQALVFEFMRLFIQEEEVPKEDLKQIVAQAFQAFLQVDPAAPTPKPTINEIGYHPLASTDSNQQRPITVAELWHGQTLAFKDLPLQFLGGLLTYFLKKRQEKINILVGTSGDTGSAAIEAVRQSPNVNIFVLYPAGGRITKIQELQMTTVQSKYNNVHVVACDGTSDELDVPILQSFEDTAFAKQFKLCSINSVNVIRILMQCTHFIYSYLRICPNADQLVDFSIPTGAAGHIAAGILTKQMAVPIGQLCAATNVNDLLTIFLNTGKFYPRQDGALQTSSPAIDIQVPYNVERMLYLMSPGTAAEKGRAVKIYLHAMNGIQRGFELPPAELHRWHEFGLIGRAASHKDVIQTIRATWKHDHYLLDPHTAVAVHAARSLTPASIIATHPTILVFSTAHAAKFLPTVSEATNLTPAQLKELFTKSPFLNVRHAMTLDQLPTRAIPFERHQDWTKKLKELIVNVSQASTNATIHQSRISSKL